MDQELKDIVEGMNATIKDCVVRLKGAELKPEDMTGIPTPYPGEGWLKRVIDELNDTDVSPPAMNPWYQSAVKEIERLEAKVCRLQGMGENDGKVVGTLNEEIASLKTKVETLTFRQTKLIDEAAHYRQLLQLSHEREQRLRDQRDVVRDMVRLAYKTVKQD